jgi:chloramphenicol 3-O-phosphotransferase
MDTNTLIETLVTIAALGGLAAPVAVLLERSHRRERREHGVRTSWTSAVHDADTRRIADEIHLLDGAAHR